MTTRKLRPWAALEPNTAEKNKLAAVWEEAASWAFGTTYTMESDKDHSFRLGLRLTGRKVCHVAQSIEHSDDE
jgi:hypothetical protein